MRDLASASYNSGFFLDWVVCEIRFQAPRPCLSPTGLSLKENIHHLVFQLLTRTDIKSPDGSFPFSVERRWRRLPFVWGAPRVHRGKAVAAMKLRRDEEEERAANSPRSVLTSPYCPGKAVSVTAF